MSRRFKGNALQLEFLEATFYATRSVYNDMLISFTIKHDLGKTASTLADASYEELLKEYNRRSLIPPYSLHSNVCKAVVMEKLKELSATLTDFISTGGKDLIWNVPYETRHTESHCVFPKGTFRVEEDKLMISGLDAPIYLGIQVHKDSVDAVTVIRHGKAEYSINLCQRDQMTALAV